MLHLGSTFQGQSTNNAEKQNDTMTKDCLGLHQLELVDETNATIVKRQKLLENKLKRSKSLAQRNAIGSAVPTTSNTNTEEVKQVDLQLSVSDYFLLLFWIQENVFQKLSTLIERKSSTVIDW